jgi:predicted DNA-binding transcriptional regulator YafY
VSQTERLYRIDQLLSERRSVSFDQLLTILEVSRATLKRDLAYLRDRLGAPIVYDRELQAYRFDKSARAPGTQYELPGLWFSAPEIHALLTMQHLLANLGPGGLLQDHIAPLMARLNGLLGATDRPAEEIRRRILIVGLGKREFQLEHFERVGSALLRRKRLNIDYYARSTDERTQREVSPQRLVHYRENWYLDAWCHLRREVRNFAVDSILRVEILDTAAREIGERTLMSVLGPGYGIFGGRQLEWAELRFTAQRARWVAAEQWHPRQRGRFDDAGYYLLQIPFADPRELLMDILRFGRDVEVIAPASLRAAVHEEARALLSHHALPA